MHEARLQLGLHTATVGGVIIKKLWACVMASMQCAARARGPNCSLRCNLQSTRKQQRGIATVGTHSVVVG
jgi:hypothetical protein